MAHCLGRAPLQVLTSNGALCHSCAISLYEKMGKKINSSGAPWSRCAISVFHTNGARATGAPLVYNRGALLTWCAIRISLIYSPFPISDSSTQSKDEYNKSKGNCRPLLFELQATRVAATAVRETIAAEPPAVIFTENSFPRVTFSFLKWELTWDGWDGDLLPSLWQLLRPQIQEMWHPGSEEKLAHVSNMGGAQDLSRAHRPLPLTQRTAA